MPKRERRPAAPRARYAWAEKPVGETEVSVVRISAFALVLFALIALLVGRLWYLQVLRGPAFREQANSNRQHPVRTVAPRGVITDYDGKPLVLNSAQFTVFVDPQALPKDLVEREGVLDRLSELVALPAADHAELKKQAMARGAIPPIAVLENVNMHVLTRIDENRLYLPGVYADVEPVRRYPKGKFAAHILGHIGPIAESELKNDKNRALGYVGGDFIGKDGI